jgi:hypothetical protein
MIAVELFRRLVVGGVILWTAGALSPASAQSAAPNAAAVANPTPSATSIGLAKELLQLKGGSQMFDGMVMGVIETAKNMFLPTNPSLGQPLNDVTAQLRKEYEPKKAEVFNEVARAYARRFTEQELREMLAFYKTSLGKKILTEEAVAVEDGFKRAQDWSNDFSEQVIKKMRAEMKKRGYDL